MRSLNGTIITGRKAIGELFAGFCEDPKDGGLNGLNFKGTSNNDDFVVGSSAAVA